MIKRKALLISCVLVLIIVVVFICLIINKTKKAESVVYVDKQIEEMLNSNDYNNAEFEQQKRMVTELLIKLRKNKMIIGFSYFDEDKLYSFEYKDHSLGGIYINKFSNITDPLPMN